MHAFSAAVVAALATAALLPAQGQSPSPFAFNRSDLRLLEECNAIDRQFEDRALVYRDPVLDDYLAGLTKPLLPTAPLERVLWKVRILRDPTVNAFGLPNGSIYIDTGLLSLAETDDQVIGRLAHEIAHVTSRHAYLFNRSLPKKIIATEILGSASVFFAGIAAPYLVDAAAGKPGEISIMAAVSGYDRGFEQEADQSAVQQLKQAGRDPAQLVRLCLLLDDKLEPEPVSFWRDQPTMKDRIAYLKKLIGLDRDPDPGVDGHYLERMKSLILLNIQLDLGTRRFRTALRSAKRLAVAYPNDAISVLAG
jgi:predicted Zn-dependent protease